MSTHILLIGGSTRARSTSQAALAGAHASAPPHIATELYTAINDLPHFNPDLDHDPLPPTVSHLRRRIAQSDGVLFSTPEYAGALPGAFKNLLEWTVGSTVMSDKPCAWLSVGGPGRGLKAHESLAIVLGYLGADILHDACTQIYVPHESVDARGELTDPELKEAIAAALATFAARLTG